MLNFPVMKADPSLSPLAYSYPLRSLSGILPIPPPPVYLLMHWNNRALEFHVVTDMLGFYWYPQRSPLKTLDDGMHKAQLTRSHEVLPKMVVYLFAQIQFSLFCNRSKILPICAASRHASSSFNFSGEEKHSSNHKGNKSRAKDKSQYCVMGRFLHLQDLKLSARLR